MIRTIARAIAVTLYHQQQDRGIARGEPTTDELPAVSPDHIAAALAVLTVLREPTEEMLDAFELQGPDDAGERFAIRAGWRAAFDVAAGKDI